MKKKPVSKAKREAEPKKKKVSSAKRTVKETAVPNNPNVCLEWNKPVTKEDTISTYTYWYSKCGRYAAVYCKNNFGEEDRFCATFKTEKRWDAICRHETYPTNYKSLEEAFQALEALHIEKFKVAQFESNYPIRIHEAKDAGIPVEIIKAPRINAAVREAIAKGEAPPVKEPKPKRDPSAPRAPRGVGVIATIIECLKGATKKKPISKETILKVLIEKFPDRQPGAMKSTISSQIPSGLKVEKKIEVQGSNEKGWWL